MNIFDAIKEKIMKFLKLDKLDYNPNSERLTFICDEDNLKKQKLKEQRVWYIGDSNELLNFYTNQAIYGNMEEPIYNRNRKNYFWGINPTETNIKRVHSGIPNAIVTTLVNAIGVPKTYVNDEVVNTRLKKIIKNNDMTNMLNQQQLPLTLVDGWGAYKVCFDLSVSKEVIIQYYEAENVEFVYKSNRLIGIIYKDYYTYNKQDYVLIEVRRVANMTSYVEYELYKLGKNNDVSPVPLETIPELADLQNIEIPNFNHILGVACKFFYDPLNKNYGRSIFDGKIDLFDDLDQILSQDSQTVRVSTPVEYYPSDLLERDRNGNPKMPSVYNRQYVQLSLLPNGDGDVSGEIKTTQPDLNFEQYSTNARSKLDFILTGLLSPATMGIDLSKRDNAEAQREKEKITLMTRNNIIDRESKILQDLYSIALSLQEYIDTGSITLEDYDITVNFEEFANPSFENELITLGGAWSNGQISTRKYVELLWRDKLNEEEMLLEERWLDSHRDADNLSLGEIEQYDRQYFE